MATLRSLRLGDNCPVGIRPRFHNGLTCPARLAIHSQWIEIPPAPGKDSEQPLLRCWWSVPEQGRLGGSQGGLRGAVLVLPEVFGLNGWVRSVADRLAGEGYAALAMPIFERTAPGLELGQKPGLQIGLKIGCVGFCFGGHLAVLPQIPGHLLCVCGDQDPLMPLEEQQAIAAALAADRLARQDQPGAPGERRLVVAQGAGHGLLCDARSDYNAEAAALGWHEMVALFAKAL